MTRLYVDCFPEGLVEVGEGGQDVVGDGEALVGLDVFVGDADAGHFGGFGGDEAEDGVFEDEAFAAGDGEEALETLREEGECSLVLMDVAMPGTEGYDTIRSIRQQQGFQSLPIVALAAEFNEDVTARCRAAGADQTLAKPIDAARLKEALERFL